MRAAPEDLVVIRRLRQHRRQRYGRRRDLWLWPSEARSGAVHVLVPKPEPLQQALFGNKRCDPTSCFALYLEQSAAYFRAVGRRCFERAKLCQFAYTPRSGRPWSAMQAILAHHTTPPDARHLTPNLLAHPATHTLVTFVRREGRRLSNLDELLAACERWSPPRAQPRGCASRAWPSLSAPGLWRARRRYGAPMCSSARTEPT